MAILTWDLEGQRFYETGVDHGVLYLPDAQGNFTNGVAWNGLTTVTEQPSGAEAQAQWADNIKYLNLYSVEEFGATVEAFTYPDEFLDFDGTASPVPGLTVGQQARKTFGLSYRTKVGNDIDGNDHGYKLHMMYGCVASPSERAYNTVNDSPEPINFSWEVTTTPALVTGHAPTSLLTVDSTKVDPASLAALEQILYGTPVANPAPKPDDVIALFAGSVTTVTAVAPTFNGTDTITIPSVTGVAYFIDGVEVAAGAINITEDTLVTAVPMAGYQFSAQSDDDWYFEHS